MSNTLLDAVRTLAGVCDGAFRRDENGYNKIDSSFGHKLAASTDESAWTDRQRYAAHRMLFKYRNQLAAHGIDYAAIPIPLKPEKAVYLANFAFNRFRMFSPYKPELVQRFREIKERKLAFWNADEKCWEILPTPDGARSVMQMVSDFDFSLTDSAATAIEDIIEKEKSAIAASRAGSADALTDDSLKRSPYPFQWAGIRYLLEHTRSWLCDDMGLGKTLQSIVAVKQKSATPCVVVCPAGVKINWQREIQLAYPGETTYIVRNGRDAIDFSAQWLIINYELLNKRLEEIVKNYTYQSVIADEAHYVKERDSKRSIALYALCLRMTTDSMKDNRAIYDAVKSGVGPKVRYFLTGTPVLNRPRELIHPLKCMGLLREFGSAIDFLNRYCISTSNYGYATSYDGSRNEEELNDKLRSLGFLRRLKEDVLKELPEKTIADLYVSITNTDEYSKAERDFSQYIASVTRDKAPEDMEDAELEQFINDVVLRTARGGTLTAITALREIVGRGKIAAAIEWINNFLESAESRKLVVFAYHISVQNAIADAFPGCAVISGDDSQTERQKNIDRFQNDGDCRLIVCSLKAGGIGINLTAASDVLIVEQDWTPAMSQQAIDRLHRIGQKNAVTAWIMNATGTYDEDLVMLLNKKAEVIHATVDGQGSAQDDSVLKDLLKNMIRKSGKTLDKRAKV